jgi:hypothetical protein
MKTSMERIDSALEEPRSAIGIERAMSHDARGRSRQRRREERRFADIRSPTDEILTRSSDHDGTSPIPTAQEEDFYRGRASEVSQAHDISTQRRQRQPSGHRSVSDGRAKSQDALKTPLTRRALNAVENNAMSPVTGVVYDPYIPVKASVTSSLLSVQEEE